MAMLVGIHAEGWDHLILQAYLAKLLEVSEADFKADFIDGSGRGWRFVQEFLPKALKRFYGQCAQLAIVAQDNDGNLDLLNKGLTEDSTRPRHWNHPNETSQTCRFCRLQELVQHTRPELNWLPEKPGSDWPIIITVPVEMIESWLLVTQALVLSGSGSLQAEMEQRHAQKLRLYGKPEPTRHDVEITALPMIRALKPGQIADMRSYSHSFAQFADQIATHRERILGSRDCWQLGDSGAER